MAYDTNAATHGEDEAEHASVRTYLVIAAILTVVTAVEVATYFMPWLQERQGLLFFSLAVLSIAKFGLVVGYYMHLRYDATFFNRVFIFPLIIAVAITVVLVVLTGGRMLEGA